MGDEATRWGNGPLTNVSTPTGLSAPDRMTVQVSARVTPCLRIRVTGRENGIASGVTPVADLRAGVMTDDGSEPFPHFPAYVYAYAGNSG